METPQTTNTYGLRNYFPDSGVYGQPHPLLFTEPNDTLRAYTADDMRQLTDPTVLDLKDGSQMRAYQVLPKGEHDESHTVVRVMDFANGIAPHSYAAAIAIAELLGVRVIVLPQSDIQLSRRERQFVRYGDLTPLHTKQAEGLEQMVADEENLTLLGVSFGAQAVVGLSKAINENGVKRNDRVVAIEPPNTVRRSKRQLLRDFSVAGNPQWAQATRQSGWQALIDVVGVADSDSSDYMKQDNVRFMRRALQLTNIAILGAMQQDSFAEDLRAAGFYLPADGRVLIAKERHSAMVPGFSLEDAYDYAVKSYQLGKKLGAACIESADSEQSVGHAVGNNPLVLASLAAV